MTNARIIAGTSGRIIGQALVCGVDDSRLQATGAKALEIIGRRALNAADHDSALDLYIAATALGAERQKNGTSGDSCSTVRQTFNDVQRMLAGQ